MHSRRKRGHIFSICSIIISTIIIAISIWYMRTQLMGTYNNAIAEINNGIYSEAIDRLLTLGDYQDSLLYLNEAYYQQAKLFFNNGEYSTALEAFQKLADYRDSTTYVKLASCLIQVQKNSKGLNEADQKEYDQYLKQLNDAMLDDPINEELCKDLVQKISCTNDKIQARKNNQQLYQEAVEYFASKNYKQAFKLFNELGDYEDSQHLAKECSIMLNRLSLSGTISAGIRYSAGVTQDGYVHLAGENFVGIDELKTWNNMLSISASNEILIGLREDGKVVVAKRKRFYSYHIDTSDWSDIVAVSAGEQYIIGLKSDGTLVAQGIDGYGETNINDWEDIIAVDTGWQHTVGLDSSGEIHIAGYNSDLLLNEIHESKELWNDIIAISTGGSTGKNNRGKGHVVGLKEDGHVVAVGDNSYGQCEVDDWENISAVSAGDYHTVGLKSNGTVVTTQSEREFPDSYKEISSWENIVAVSAGYGFTLGLKSDGTVVAAGYDRQGQIDVDTWNNIAIYDEWHDAFSR